MKRTLHLSSRRGAPAAILLATALLAVGASPAAAQERDWCETEDRDRDRHCELREFALPASGALRVDAAPNGGIEVAAWGRNEVGVTAKVVARADDEAEARAIVDRITISTSGTIEADGPRTGRGEGWWVSYRIRVPASYDLDLASLNGGIGIDGIEGDLELSTTNGGIHLEDAGGDVRARTTNGGLHVTLTGSRWEGAGLDARTTNGGVVLEIPDGYSARLEMGTTNGGFDMEMPMTVSGRISGRHFTTELGSGGAPVRVVTTNGGVRVARAGR